ncbi:uncharacterized protein N7487_009237 [Penicillium crustosum]|uniref:uncharacterized protein n=1 Tax=Penicillium crustosum TaxID=36656 RepID=UPI00238947FF|nr:uncharacterized protein N7487_009237 [Penicillium crustosum]KAJ5394934.1 hypothetical protein N7487_009237 [Penicillium crustosum]
MVQLEDGLGVDINGTVEVLQSSSEDTLENALDTTAEKPNPNETWNWDDDPSNPYNWPTSQKVLQVVMIGWSAFTTTVGVSILSPAHSQLMEEFDVSSTVAILPLSLYVFALALGPIVGGPLSETVGRYPVYIGAIGLGTLFTLGVGFCPTFAGACHWKFYSQSERLALDTVGNDLLRHLHGHHSCNYQRDLSPYHQASSCQGTRIRASPIPPLSSKLRLFVTISLLRPIHMLLTEPIVGFICLYIACEFATLFSFFAAFPLIFQGIYHFNIEDSGLVFLAIVIGSILGTVTVILCNIFLYLPKVSKHPDGQVPPEYRLYPALIGSVGLPIALFWFAWTTRADISWASPVVAIVVFAWGNLCVFVSTTQYIVDTYHGLTVASAMSANGLARYGLAAAFPLFTVQMYTRLGAGWASSLLGFIAVALLPVPWVLFKSGKRLRALSKYETAENSTK